MTRTHTTVASVVLVLFSVTAIASAQAPGDKADALSEAARKGDAAAVKKLLDEGVNVDTKFRYNRTALSFAADRGHVEVARLLIERGADLNVKDTFYNATALTWAMGPAMDRTPRHGEVARLLLQHGALGKEDALMSAAAIGEAETVKVILGLGPLPPATLSDALEAAVKDKHADVVSLLEQAGAKARPELKLEPAQLARYAGTYKNAQVTMDIAIADGRLAATINGRRMTLIARDETTFGISEQPGPKVTFRIDQGKAVSMTLDGMGAPLVLTRVE